MALYFPASNERISHGNNSSLNSLSNWTAMLWLRLRANTANGEFLAAKNGAGSNDMYWYAGTMAEGNGQCGWFLDRTSDFSSVVANPGTLTLDVWAFVAMRDGTSQTPTLFKGDVSTLAAEVSYAFQGGGTSAASDNSAGALVIGGGDTGNRQSNCELAYVWLYNRMLTDSEVWMHQWNGFYQTDGCVLHTSYWNTSAAGLKDLSPFGNHGTVNNTPDVVPHVSIPFRRRERIYVPVAAAGAGDRVIPPTKLAGKTGGGKRGGKQLAPLWIPPKPKIERPTPAIVRELRG